MDCKNLSVCFTHPFPIKSVFLILLLTLKDTAHINNLFI